MSQKKYYKFTLYIKQVDDKWVGMVGELGIRGWLAIPEYHYTSDTESDLFSVIYQDLWKLCYGGHRTLGFFDFNNKYETPEGFTRCFLCVTEHGKDR